MKWTLTAATFLLPLVIASLHGCGDEAATRVEQRYQQEESLKTVSNKLPPGCTVGYYGDARVMRTHEGSSSTYTTSVPVVAVSCAGVPTTTTNSLHGEGKYEVPHVVVTQ